jgi:hypothetical protein
MIRRCYDVEDDTPGKEEETIHKFREYRGRGAFRDVLIVSHAASFNSNVQLRAFSTIFSLRLDLASIA